MNASTETGRAAVEQLASCLRYPVAHTASQARLASNQFEASAPALARALRDLAAEVETDLLSMEERYTRLFDMSPVCNLYICHHLFGDDQRRSAALVGLRAEFKKLELSEEHDLPDFLPNVLRLYMHLPHATDRDLLMEHLIRPGTKRMADRVSDKHDAYFDILRGLPDALGQLSAWMQDDGTESGVQTHV